MANRHMQRCSMSLVFWEKQMETTIRYHYISTRISKIKNWYHQMLARTGAQGTGMFTYCWWECKNDAAGKEFGWLFTKLSIHLTTHKTCDPAPTYLPEKQKHMSTKKTHA